jgi:hypothetical protein
MKTRIGFVSNSSTTSFCIYGDEIPHAKAEDAEELGLEVHYDHSWFNSVCYAGLSWYNMKDDETCAQFKERVDTALLQLGEDLKGQTIQVAYYDG